MRYLIAIDGVDGCGKDTHALRIRRSLEDHGEKVVVFRHPSDRLFGRMSKKAVQGSGAIALTLTALFFALDVLMSVWRYRRMRDGTVIFVRYLLGTAYLPPHAAHISYRFFRRTLPFPDLPLFIDIDPAVAIRRIELRDQAREMFETERRLARVRGIAKSIATEEWIVIDNSEDGDAPFARVDDILMERRYD